MCYMYMCEEIPVRRRNFECGIFDCKHKFIRRAYVGAVCDEDYIVFKDENLKALGITEGYIDYFYKQYLYNFKMMKEAKKMVDLYPFEEIYKNDLRRFENEAHFFKCQIIDIHECSVKRVKCPEEEWMSTIYYWMASRDYVRDVPVLQKYKLYPELTYTDGESYLYYYDNEKYQEFCENPPEL